MHFNKKELFVSLGNYYQGKKRFFDALFIGTLSAIVSQGLNFIVVILIARRLGQSSMGQFSIIQSTVIMLLTFSVLGQNVSATALTSRFKKKYPNQLGILLGNSYLISFLMATIASLFTICFAGYFFKEVFIDSVPPALSLFVCIVWFFAMTFDMMQVSILIGMEAYKDLLKTDFIKGIFAITAIYPLSKYLGLSGAVAGYAIVNCMGVGINQWFIRRKLGYMQVRIVFKPDFRIVRRILNIGLPIFIAAVFMSLTNWMTNKIVFNAVNGPVALGIVFVCRQILILIQFIPAQISRVLLPIIAENTNTLEEKMIKKASLGLSMAICLCLALIAFFFEDFIYSVYKLDNDLARWPYRIILITVVFSASNLILGQFIIAGKNPWYRTFADIALSLTMVAVSMILINLNPYLTLPVAMLLSFIVSNLVLAYCFIYKNKKRNSLTRIRTTI